MLWLTLSVIKDRTTVSFIATQAGNVGDLYHSALPSATTLLEPYIATHELLFLGE